MEGILGQPFIPLRMAEGGCIATDIAHEDTLEARQVAIDRLTNLDDAIAIGQIFGSPVHDGIGISTILLLAKMFVEHHCGSQTGTLIVRRGPGIAHGSLLRVAAVIDLTIEDSLGIDVIEQTTLTGIDGGCLLEIVFPVQGNAQITGTDGSGTIDTGGGTSVALLPHQCTVGILSSTGIHAIEIALGCGQILGDARQQIGTHTGYAHPGDIIIVLIVSRSTDPVARLTSYEVDIEILKHGGILTVTCGLKGIENHLEHLGITPPATVSYHITCAGLVVIMCFPLLHHVVANLLGERGALRFTLRHLPYELRGIGSGNRHQTERTAVGRHGVGGECIPPGGTGIDDVFILTTLHGHYLPTATRGCCGTLQDGDRSTSRYGGSGCQNHTCIGIGDIKGGGTGCLQNPPLGTGLRIGPHLCQSSCAQRGVLGHD